MKPHLMNKYFLNLSAVAVLFAASTALAEDQVPLQTDLPKPLFVGTPGGRSRCLILNQS
ncbi:MAG: hypothetical protein WDN00_17150 [Limisphaerales bacterium]